MSTSSTTKMVIKRAWAWLTKTSPSIADPAMQLRSYSLAIFLSVLLLASFLFDPLALIFFDSIPSLTPYLFAYLIFIIAYVLNRIGHYQLSVYLLLFGLLSSAYLTTSMLDFLPIYQTIPIYLITLILASFLLDLFALFVYTAAAMAVYFAVRINSVGGLTPDLDLFISMAWLWTASGLLGVWKVIRQREEEVRVAALTRNERLFRRLYLDTPIMMYSIDENGILTQVSNRWLALLGYHEEEVIGTHIADYVIDDQQDYVRHVGVPQFVKTGSLNNAPSRLVTKNGDTLDVLVSAVAEYDDADKFVRSLSVLVDITEQKRLFEEGQARERLLAALTAFEAKVLAATEVGEIAENTVTYLQEFTQSSVTMIVLFDIPAGTLQPVAFNANNPQQLTLKPLYPLQTTDWLKGYYKGINVQLNDITQLDNLPPFVAHLAEQGVRAMMGIPLVSSNQLLGVLALGSFEAGSLSESDMQIAGEYARPLAIGIAKLQLVDQLQTQTDRLRLLSQLAQAIIEVQTVEEIGRLTVLQLSQAIQTDFISIFFIDKANNTAFSIVDYEHGEISTTDPVKLPLATLILLPELKKNVVIRVKDIAELPIPPSDAEPVLTGFQSLLLAPLFDKQELSGILSLRAAKIDHFSEQDERTIEAIARPLAVGFAKARLSGAVQQQAARLDVLNSVARSILAADSVQETADIASNSLLNHISCAFHAIMLIDEQEAVVERIAYASHDGNDYRRDKHFPVENYLLYDQMVKGETIIVDNMAERAFESDVFAYYHARGIESLLIVPMLVDGKLIGNLTIGMVDLTPMPLDQTHFIASFVPQLAIGLNHARLYEQTQRQANRLAALTALDEAILAAGETNTIAHLAADHVFTQLDVDFVSILMIDEEAGYAERLVSRTNQKTTLRAGERIPISKLTMLAQLREGNIAIVEDTHTATGVGLVERIREDKLRSIMTVPLMSRGRLIGNIGIGRRNAGPYTQREQHMVRELSSPLSIAFMQANLVTGLRRQTDRLSSIRDVERAILAARSPQYIAELAIEHLSVQLQFERASVLSIDETTGVAEILAARAANDTVLASGATFPFGPPELMAAFRGGHSVLIHDLALEEDISPEMAQLIEAGYQSTVSVPIRTSERLVGRIAVASKRRSAYSAEDARTIEALASTMAVAMIQADLVIGLEQQTEKLAAIRDVQVALLAAQTAKEIAERVFDYLERQIQYDRISVVLIDVESESIEFVAVRSLCPPYPELGKRYKLSITYNEVLFINDLSVAADMPKAFQPLLENGLRSLIAIPLQTQGRLIGRIVLAAFETNAFTQDDIDAVEGIMSGLALALLQRRLLTDMQAYSADLIAIREVEAAILAAQSPNEIAEDVFDHVAKRIDCERMAIAYIDEETSQAELFAVRCLSEPFTEVGATIPTAIDWTQNVVRVDDLTQTELGTAYLNELIAYGFRSMLSVILRTPEQLIGRLTVMSKQHAHFDDVDQTFLELLAPTVALALIQKGLIDTLQLQTDDLIAVREVESAILQARSSREIAEVVFDGIQQRMDGERLALLYLDIERAEGEFLAIRAPEQQETPVGAVIPIDLGRAQQMTRMGDIRNLPKISVHMQRLADEGYRSLISVPLRTPDKLIGRLSVMSKQVNYFQSKNQAFLEMMGSTMALALVQAKLLEAVQASEQSMRELNADLEQRVALRTEQLHQANDELEAFTYSVSHDLRAPLRHVDGFIRLLMRRERENLGERSLHYIENIEDASQRMGYLIDDLLRLSRTNRTELEYSIVDMKLLLASVIAEQEPAESQRQIEWVIGDVSDAWADAALVKIVWTNLIGNAVKYTGPRDKARIEIAPLPLVGENAENFVGYAVHDNGVGFDATYKDKLFGVFQRLHRREEFDGTGIGLATVQRIILRHGGTVWGDGALDKGASFYFTLPRVEG